MKVVIFTTETSHHTFFIKKLSQVLKNIEVICEIPQNLKFKFKTHHEFEKKREEYEKKYCFNNKPEKIEDFVNVNKFKSINSYDAYRHIKKLNKSIFIVFGTRIIKKKIIDLNKDLFFNLHGGDPLKYRGLDSHLWSIYNKDFDSLRTTIHKLDQGIDTGEIVDQEKLKFNSKSSLVNLRIINTNVCINLVKRLIKNFNNQKIILNKQKKKGKYYSAMPTELKKQTIKIFNEYIKNKFNL